MTLCNHHQVQCDACYRVSLMLAKHSREAEDRADRAEAELEDTKLALVVHQAEVARLLVILREAEWGGSTGIDYEIEAPACPLCGGLRNEQKFNAWGKLVGHRPGCSYLGLVTTSARRDTDE